MIYRKRLIELFKEIKGLIRIVKRQKMRNFGLSMKKTLERPLRIGKNRETLRVQRKIFEMLMPQRRKRIRYVWKLCGGISNVSLPKMERFRFIRIICLS